MNSTGCYQILYKIKDESGELIEIVFKRMKFIYYLQMQNNN